MPNNLSLGSNEYRNEYNDKLIEEDEQEGGIDSDAVVAKCAEIQKAISEGATSFPFTEYKYLGIFMVVFGAIIFLFLGSVKNFSTKRALTSALSGFLGMKIATYANARTTIEARKSIGKAFITAFRSGAVMGFLLAANGLLVLYVSINLFNLYYGDDWEGLYESITDYGLGGSSMALFGRVGGGIYTKAADVGADLVGKAECNIPEDDPRNPAVIADNVGDNIGDIAGMGSDLFGSYVESSCAALFVASISSLEFTIFDFGSEKVVKNWHLFFCVPISLWAGLVIGYTMEYYTSNAYSPVQDAADACRTGAATNVIFGLALGYNSVIIPIFSIAASIYVSFSLAAMYGIAVAALGMLSTIATGLTIDGYGPISDNACGIAEMTGAGFAIGSAALVSLALFGAYVSRGGIKTVDVLAPKVFIGLLVGAMLPYWFSAMTMKSVGSVALKMVEEVRRQFNTIPGLMEGTVKLDYATCVKISTDASLKEMIPPGALVMLTPVIASTFFGVETLAGVLAGSLVSGVQVAISASNTGGAWDNAKKYIEAGATEHARTLGPKGSDAHKAAVIGDTVGDPLKDTSGPSLNILIKLMAVESLVFAPFFATHGEVLFKLLYN
ncbi:hypothetical protein K7X08_009316 [Anisodus acutangulus]|uniref:H(+)-exporting diphosphatase n=1 Tax=Anisodus acutangulus TaxID=402998 RepID=A0A9Q1MZJ7_9SOLA|nr:hypothetical protein K7X08_009316 [Anisodus acutangulus]